MGFLLSSTCTVHLIIFDFRSHREAVFVEVSKSVGKWFADDTLQETNISPKKCHFEDDFPFPKVGYVNPLEGIL